MVQLNGPPTLLIAEDDEDDQVLIMKALRASPLRDHIKIVMDGEELLEYLQRRGRYEDPVDAPFPGLILMDLNMPRKDGREALRQIKSDAQLNRIPVVVLTTSSATDDIRKAYELGANAFVTKPATFAALQKMLATIGEFWFDMVRRPTET